ncbi:hypothetical protein HMPREF0281_00050 [Corynebacterium ammoniagenes DSM 20306]|uniref:Uncharacterized protein n=1 Tax=Corynebacterium ammoniagenes DSM 20306 TaxID=649754 RepID=A0ABP2IJ92_CORAM|nr:hypothetical protein HMPREF0281_00050 [Corynebacterium ammoniagenes DSM 20306]
MPRCKLKSTLALLIDAFLPKCSPVIAGSVHTLLTLHLSSNSAYLEYRNNPGS